MVVKSDDNDDIERQWRRTEWRNKKKPKNNVQDNETIGMVKNIHKIGRKERNKRNKKKNKKVMVKKKQRAQKLEDDNDSR